MPVKAATLPDTVSTMGFKPIGGSRDAQVTFPVAGREAGDRRRLEKATLGRALRRSGASFGRPWLARDPNANLASPPPFVWALSSWQSPYSWPRQ